MNRISFSKDALVTMRKYLTDEELGNVVHNLINYWIEDDDGCELISEKACLMYDVLCCDVDRQKETYNMRKKCNEVRVNGK